jgi:hypothetical protein
MYVIFNKIDNFDFVSKEKKIDFVVLNDKNTRVE